MIEVIRARDEMAMNEETRKLTTEERLQILETAYRTLASELDDVRRHVNDLREENARLRRGADSQ